MDWVSAALSGIAGVAKSGWDWLTGNMEEKAKAEGEAQAYKQQLEQLQKMQTAGSKDDDDKNKTWIYLVIGGIAVVVLIFLLKK